MFNSSQISSLNSNPQHNLQGHSLVRFRCMVQDMFDPEFYLGTYEVKDTKTGMTHMRCGRYRDIAQCLVRNEMPTTSRIGGAVTDQA